jgi:ubiquinol-cytochrome c reductase cytochrome b subunit
MVGLAAALLAVLALTGLYLAQFYNPSPIGAYDSVLYTITRAPLGDWVRSIHYWAAGGLVLTVAAFLILMVWHRMYRQPRRLIWWLSVGGVALVFLLIVTGTVLRADQEGYEAMAHLVTGGRFTGVVGSFFTQDFTTSTPLLTRVFSLHTSLLPLALIAVAVSCSWLASHLDLQAAHKDSRLTRPMGFAGVALLVFAVLGALSAFASVGIGQRPVAGVEITKPFWPLLWVYGLENTMGLWGMVLGPALVFGALAALPLLDRGAAEAPRRPWITWFVAVLGTLVLALWLYGAIGPGRQHLGM